MREFKFKKEGPVVFLGDDPCCFGVHAQVDIPGKDDSGCFLEQIDAFCLPLAREGKRVLIDITIKELQEAK